MASRLARAGKWLAIMLVAVAIGIGLLMAEPPEEPFLKLIASILGGLWDGRILGHLSYGATIYLVLQAAVLICAIWFLAKLISGMIRVRFLDRTDLEEGRKYALQRIVGYVIFGIGALTCVHVLQFDLSSLTVFSGALGIGLGLGFQALAKDFVSGLILLFEQPIKVGDRIEVGNLQGNIVTIGTRATSVRTNDNSVIVVPNSEFTEARVTNLTLNDRSIRMSVPVGVSYSSDPETVRAILTEVGTSHPDVLSNPKPDVVFTGFGDSSLDFELRVWTERLLTTPRAFASELYFEAFRAFKREGIEIPFPQRDVHVKDVAAPLEGALNPARPGRDSSELA